MMAFFMPMRLGGPRSSQGPDQPQGDDDQDQVHDTGNHGSDLVYRTCHINTHYSVIV